MAYTSDNLWQTISKLNGDFTTTIGTAGSDTVHNNPNRDDGFYVSEDTTNLIGLGDGNATVLTGASDDFLWLGKGIGSVDLGGGTNYADFSQGSYKFIINDDTGTTTLAGFDVNNDRFDFRGSDGDAFADAVVDAAVDFVRRNSDDLTIEFDNTTIVLEDFQGDLGSFVWNQAGWEGRREFSLAQAIETHPDPSQVIDGIF